MTLTQSQVLQNRYRVVALLSQGGFGAVYKGWDLRLNKHVAIKENLDTSPEAQRQFQHEAQILAGLSHPNLPRVIDHFLIPGMGQYLVMDFVEGDDLQVILDKTPQPLAEDSVLAWIEQVCDALAYLHAQPQAVIHRDIKPANIKITPQGKVVLVDFGISKVYDPQLRTTVGARAVTPGYSPLEQYGQGTTDQRSDIYALGATLYVLLTGHEPQESVQRVLADQVAPAHQVNPQVSPIVSQTIQRAMSVNPTGRYQTGAEFKVALTAAAQQAKRERFDALYQQAVISANQNDVDGAEATLRQVLALDANHTEARALLDQITRRRDAMRRYQALATTIAQARAEAGALHQTDPDLPDPQGVLRMLAGKPLDRPTPPTRVVAPAAAASPYARRISGLLVVGAVLVGVWGMSKAITAMPHVLGTQSTQDLSNGNFLFGLSVGVLIGVALMLNLLSARSRLVNGVLSALIAGASAAFAIGLSQASVAVPHVPATSVVQDLAYGNALMGVGVAAALSGIVLAWLAGRS